MAEEPLKKCVQELTPEEGAKKRDTTKGTRSYNRLKTYKRLIHHLHPDKIREDEPEATKQRKVQQFERARRCFETSVSSEDFAVWKDAYRRYAHGDGLAAQDAAQRRGARASEAAAGAGREGRQAPAAGPGSESDRDRNRESRQERERSRETERQRSKEEERKNDRERARIEVARRAAQEADVQAYQRKTQDNQLCHFWPADADRERLCKDLVVDAKNLYPGDMHSAWPPSKHQLERALWVTRGRDTVHSSDTIGWKHGGTFRFLVPQMFRDIFGTELVSAELRKESKSKAGERTDKEFELPSMQFADKNVRKIAQNTHIVALRGAWKERTHPIGAVDGWASVQKNKRLRQQTADSRAAYISRKYHRGYDAASLPQGHALKF